MPNNKVIPFLFFLFLTSPLCYGQAKDLTSQVTNSKKHALTLYLGGGAGYFPSNSGAPGYLKPTLSRINGVWTARVMWKPDHRLKAGLETGYMTFYSYKFADSDGNKGKISLNSVPLLLEFSVALTKRFNLFAGPGVYWLNTDLDYSGKTLSKKLSMGWMAAAAYVQPVSKTVGIGAEAKWLYAAETIRGSFGLQMQLVWRFLKW